MVLGRPDFSAEIGLEGASDQEVCTQPEVIGNLGDKTAESGRPATTKALEQLKLVPNCSDDGLVSSIGEREESGQILTRCGGDEALLELDSIRPTGKRYFILFMFTVLCALKSFQWVCFASITNVVSKYYHVDNIAVNWTAIIFMVTFLILALPVSWLMEQIGLRNSVLIGSLGTTLGIVIKCFSCYPDGYYLSMFGHLLVGFSEPFFFSIYSQISSVWFPDHQVSLATSIGLLGEEIGIALGFIVPSLLVGNDLNEPAAIQQGLFQLFLGAALISTLNTSSIALFFDDQPKFAPGIARYKQQLQQAQELKLELELEPELKGNGVGVVGKQGQTGPTGQPGGGAEKLATNLAKHQEATKRRRRGKKGAFREKLVEQMKQLQQFLSDKNFNLLLIGFGLNVGTNYSIRTILNQMIVGGGGGGGGNDGGSSSTMDPAVVSAAAAAAELSLQADDSSAPPSDAPADFEGLAAASAPKQWADANLVVGNAGLILIVAGFLGTVVCGHLLDKFHRYKLTTALAYLFTLLTMLALTYCLRRWSSSQLALYTGCALLGFFITGYLCCGFEYAVEISYPKPELASSTLLNISAQIFGIPISLASSAIVDAYGNQAVGLFFAAILLLGLLLACLQEGELRRQNAVGGDDNNVGGPAGTAVVVAAAAAAAANVGGPEAAAALALGRNGLVRSGKEAGGHT